MSVNQNSIALLDSRSKLGNEVFATMKLFVIWAMAVLILSSLAMFANVADAQDYTVEPVSDRYLMVPEPEDEDEKLSPADRTTNKTARTNRNKDKGAVQRILSSGGDMTGKAMKDYFNDYIFAEMTQPEWLSKAGDNRKDFFRGYLNSNMSSANRQTFIERVMIPLLAKRIKDESLYPAARVNAVVLIGLADDQALERISSTPPQPNMLALQALVSIYKDDAYPPYLKVSALSGILRHVNVDTATGAGRVTQAIRQSITTDVLAALGKINQDDPELTDDLNYWLTRRSIQFLGAAKVPGQNGAVFDRLSSYFAKNSPAPVWVKLDAVMAMKNFPTTGVSQEKVGSAIESSITFLAEALKAEATAIEVAVESLVYDNILLEDKDFEVDGTNFRGRAGSGGGGMGGMMGGMMGGGDEDEDDDTGMGGPGMGGGMGGGMGPGAGFGGGSGGGLFDEEEEIKPIVELPNYELNQIRRRIKVLTFSVNDVLSDDESSLKKAAPAKQQTLIKDLASPVRALLKGSSIGVRDMLADKEDEEPKRESFAMQLMTVCTTGSDDIYGVLGVSKEKAAPANAPVAGEGAAPAAPAADAGAAPSEDDSPFGGGN